MQKSACVGYAPNTGRNWECLTAIDDAVRFGKFESRYVKNLSGLVLVAA